MLSPLLKGTFFLLLHIELKKRKMKTNFRIICSTIFLVVGYAASAQYVEKLADLNQMGALKLAEQAKLEAQKLDKNVSEKGDKKK